MAISETSESVVRATIKVNGEGQTLTPATPKSLNRSAPKLAQVIDNVGDICHHAKFYSDRIRGFAPAHARLRAPLFTRLSFWGVLEITYSQDATTDIDAKYVKRRGSVQGCAFLRVAKPHFNIYTPFFP